MKNFKFYFLAFAILSRNISSMYTMQNINPGSKNSNITDLENYTFLAMLIKGNNNIYEIEHAIKVNWGDENNVTSTSFKLKRSAREYCINKGILEKIWSNPEAWKKCQASGFKIDIKYKPVSEYDKNLEGQNIFIHDFSFSPCGKYLFITEWIPARGYMFDIISKEIKFIINQDFRARVTYAAQFSPDGKYIVYFLESKDTDYDKKFVVVCDTETGAETKRFDVTEICQNYAPRIKFNKSGTGILIQDSLNAIYLLNLEDGKLLEKLNIDLRSSGGKSFDLEFRFPEDEKFHPFITSSSQYELNSKNIFKGLYLDLEFNRGQYSDKFFGSIRISDNKFAYDPNDKLIFKFENGADSDGCKFNSQGTFFGILKNCCLTIYPTPYGLFKTADLKNLIILIKDNRE